MPDIFDQVAEPTRDIFDEAASESTGDIFDQAVAVTEPERPSGELGSRLLSGMASRTADVAAMSVRASKNLNPMAKMADWIVDKTGVGVKSDEVITELEGVSSRARDDYGVDPRFDKRFSSQVVEGAASLAPIIASGGLFAPLTGAAMAGEAGRREAEEAGAPEDAQFYSGLSNAATAFVSEKLLGLPALIKSAKALKVPAATFREMVETVTRQAALTALREGTQEGLESVSEDLIATALYDFDRGVDWKKAFTSARVGALIGTGMGSVAQVSEQSTPRQNEVAAAKIDQSLAQLATEAPPALELPETFIPAEQVPVAETPSAPTENAVQGPPVMSDEGVPVSEFVSTAINTPGGVVTGPEQGTAHPNMLMEALDKGLDEPSVEANLGFAFKTPEGVEWVDRVEAGRRLTESGQLTGLEPGTPLTSEHIRNEVEGVTFSPQPQSDLKLEESANLLNQYRESAIAMAKRRGATDINAEDIFQKVITDLAPKLASGELKPNKLAGLVAKAVQFATSKEIAPTQKGGEAITQSGDIPGETGETLITKAATPRGPRAEMVSEEDVASLEGRIAKLPETQRKVMRAMIDFEGATDREIANITGMTEGAVGQAKMRAREVLREFVRQQGIGEKLGPGAANEREFKIAQYTAAADIYQGLKESKQLDYPTFEKNVLRVYEDAFNKDQIEEMWAVAQEASAQFTESGKRKPIPAIVDQLLGGDRAEGITALKNAQTDLERRARGMPALVKAARQTQPQAWDAAMRYLNENPQAQFELLNRLRNNPEEIIGTRDSNILLFSKIQAQNHFERALEAMDRATDEQTRMEAFSLVKEANLTLTEIEEMAQRVGTQAGRTLANRKMLISKDYSPARVATELQALKGEELTQEEVQKARDISENIQRSESELDARTAQLEEEASKTAFKQTVKEFEGRLPFDQRILAIANKIVAKLDAAAQRARNRIRERLKNTNMQADPTLIYDLAVIGASKIAHGLRDLAWRNSMREEFGEEVNPHLDQVYKESDAMIDRLEEELPNEVRTKVRQVVRKEGSRDVLESTQEKLKQRVQDGEGLTDMREMVQKMALALVRSGVTNPDQLLDTMHSMVSPLQPGISKREVMDLISGYGDFKALDMEKAKVTLRDLKGQFQNLAKLEDIQKKGKVEKTGIERRKPSDAERRLIAQVNEAKKQFNVGTLEAYKTRLTHSIADLQDRINKGDFRKRLPRPLDVSKDPEAVRLAAENAKWKKEFEIAKLTAQRAQETNLRKGLRLGKEALNIPRAIKSSMDFSAVLRQGGFVSFGNPVRAAKNLAPMFKAAVSEEAFNRSEAEIRSRPNSDLYKRYKLYLADIDGSLDSREEAYRAELADKIPIVGKGIRGSNRAYVTFLNRMRADTFDALVGNLPFTPTEAQLKAIAHYINVATGRGDLGAHGSAAETLSTVLWSPRLLISRIQLLTGEPIARGDAAGVRKVIAKEYAKALIGGSIVIALGLMAGADIEDDPRSSDFGKLRFGNTRIDPWMGLQQITTLGTRLGSAAINAFYPGVTTGDYMDKNKRLKYLGAQSKKGPNDPTVPGVLGRFLWSKTTPLIGAGIEALSGEDFVGRKRTLAQTAMSLGIPLSLQDTLRIMEDQGMEKATALQILNLFGMSVQHQEDRQR